jgi:hypothetical protein
LSRVIIYRLPPKGEDALKKKERAPRKVPVGGLNTLEQNVENLNIKKVKLPLYMLFSCLLSSLSL